MSKRRFIHLRDGRPRALERPAFTLVELLVAITIILILMALTLVVVSRIWRNVDNTQTQYEISKLAEGCERFKSVFGRYPPARILLCERAQDWTAALSAADAKLRQLAEESADFLQNVFPGIELTNPAISHDWAGRAQHPIVTNNFTGLMPAPGTNVYLLEGEEALLYFLNGPRYSNDAGNVFNPANPATRTFRTPGMGWNSNKKFPCAPPALTGGPARLGPFFDIADESRVVYSVFNPSVNGLPQWNAAPGNFSPGGFSSLGYFPVYMDRFGMPYIYFMAYHGGGGTNNYRFPGAPYLATGGDARFLLECNVLLSQSNRPGFMPYFQNLSPPIQVSAGNQNQPWAGMIASAFVLPNLPQITFYKADRFQIISAGRDKDYGLGGFLVVNNPESNLTSAADFDNLTNVTQGTIKP